MQPSVVTLTDGYGAVRLLARGAALELDRVLGTRLAYELRAYDVQAAREARDEAATKLLTLLETNAKGRLGPPPDSAFVSNEYQLDLERIRSLLGLQSAQAISVGE